MTLPLIYYTVIHLKPIQVFFQLYNRIRTPRLQAAECHIDNSTAKCSKTIVKQDCYNDGRFTFLNITDAFHGWNISGHGPLWAYNLNYMDWLEQENISQEECIEWIDRFIDDLPANHVGLDPYPVALRIINWVKFFSKNPECQSKQRNDSTYAQTQLLERKLEYHLLGNHLLEDSYALTIASIYFSDERMFRKASKLLLAQLNEQILPDGMHYEQSPMYHCIMLDRLLDCINFSVNNILFEGQETFNDAIKKKASQMLGHLASITYSDGAIPLLNDSANDIAPTANELYDYAKRLNVEWSTVRLSTCGYRKLGDGHMEAVIDIGNIAASYQPGHSHADTFSYELRIDSQPIIVDTGISTYNKNDRRQYERSTAAHNTVTVGGMDSSQVWGGFRMGRRARVTIVSDESNDVVARHDGFGRMAIHERHFSCKDNAFCVEDKIIGSDTEAVSYLHFCPGLKAEIISEKEGIVSIGNVRIKASHCHRMALKTDCTATEYNRLNPCDVLEMHFVGKLEYSVSPGK